MTNKIFILTKSPRKIFKELESDTLTVYKLERAILAHVKEVDWDLIGGEWRYSHPDKTLGEFLQENVLTQRDG